MATNQTGCDDAVAFKVIDSVQHFQPGAGRPIYHRIRLESGQIKYLIVEEPQPTEDAHHQSPPPFALTTIPQGDWNVAQLAHTEDSNGNLAIILTENRVLCDTTSRWCDRTIDMDKLGERFTGTRAEIIPVAELYPIGFFAGPTDLGWPERLLVVWDWLPLDGKSNLEWEVRAHEWVQGLNLAPKFLGHLTENGGSRVIGYALEPVAVRAAGPEDVDACRAALKKLHGLGVTLGQVARGNFMVREDGEGVLLHPFQLAYKTADVEELAQEMAKVEAALNEPEELLPEEKARLKSIKGSDQV